MGCQTSTEVKKLANEQPTDPPKQKNDTNNPLINEKDDLKKEEVAATKIQALYRGFRTRLKLEEDQKKESKSAKKKNKLAEEEKKADALLKVVLEDKAVASQEAKLNQRNNPEEEVFRSLRKIIQKSIDQDEPPEAAKESIVEKVNDLAASAKPKLSDKKDQFSNKLTSGIGLAGRAVEQAIEEAKNTGQNIKQTIQEEIKEELETTEQTVKRTAENVGAKMESLKEKFQEFDISKVASETVESVKEKVSGLIPDKVKEILPEKKSDSESRPESGKSDNSENETISSDKSNKSTSQKSASKDENNNPEKKQEEEVDIDLADPEVAKVANKLQSAFKFKRNIKPAN